MKHCGRCDNDKPETEFYAHPGTKDGLMGCCKECHKAAVSSRRAQNIEQAQAYDRQRGKLPHRKMAVRDYHRTENGRRSHAKSIQKWQDHNPEKRAAHVIVGNAIRDGKLQRQPCEKCGDDDVHAHHEDYSKPLDVHWLCPACHSDHHHNEPEAFTKQ